jgi:hypothetical protein
MGGTCTASHVCAPLIKRSQRTERDGTSGQGVHRGRRRHCFSCLRPTDPVALSLVPELVHGPSVVRSQGGPLVSPLPPCGLTQGPSANCHYEQPILRGGVTRDGVFQ